MENKKVPISILLPIRNGAKFLKTAIIDIEQNMDSEDEIVVIDDGSTDGTDLILKQWKKYQNRLLVFSTGGKGLVHALNLGIEKSNHEWIARFDVDDRYNPNRLKLQRELLTRDRAAVFCDYTFTSEKNSKLGWIPCAVTPEATTISLISSQRTPHPGVIFNKSAVRDAGMYRPEDFPAEDLSLWLRLSRIGKLVGSPEKLLNYTLNPNSVSSKQRELALQTKVRLLREIPIDANAIIFLINNLEEQFNFYNSVEFSARRKTLLVRDLLLCKKENLIPKTHEKLLKRVELSLLADIRSYSEAWQMILERRERNNFRKSI